MAKRSAAVPWVTLRSHSRSLSVRLRARPPPSPRQPRKKPPKKPKRLPPLPREVDAHALFRGHAFEVLLALGLVPKRKELLAPATISLNRMHVMEGECDMVAESAPDLVSAKTIDLKLTKEDRPEPELAARSPDTPDDKQEQPAEPLVNGEAKEHESASPAAAATDTQQDTCVAKVEETCLQNGKEEERTKSVEEKDDTVTGAKDTVKEVVEVPAKESVSGGCSEEEDRTSVTSSQSRKRAALVEAEGEGEGSSSESDVGVSKRQRLDTEDGEDERERLVREYVEECTDSMDEMNRAADKLQREIGALGELLRAKELEWNSILRLRKLKEEMLERLLRRRRLSSVLTGHDAVDNLPAPPPYSKAYKPSMNNMLNNNHMVHPTNGGLMMVPLVSSSPSPCHVTSSFSRGPPPHAMPPRPAYRMQRPILPKPSLDNSVVGEGRQGAIVDVKSIIADYRSRHPESAPRRGRRMRPHEQRLPLDHQPPVVSSTRISGSPALMSMANMALGSGSHVRENPSGPSSYMGQDNSRPSSADSSRGGHLDMLQGPGLSFKDALVQFAKMSQPPKPPPPPPPYPEVTLHPVSPPPPPSHSSLLHGILTKSAPVMQAPPPQQPHRATTFSPTLARLLTAPERTPTTNTTGHFRPPATTNARVNLCEILSSSKKNRNEITITPVSGSNKTKDDIVLLPDEDEENDGDRLVIDESRDNAANSTELPENVPECQGCHQRAAQFVCAGCGNQWYCSRECQVSAWEEHSEMCSG